MDAQKYDFYQHKSQSNREWCEEHGEDYDELNAQDEDEGYPEDDNQQML